MASPTKAYVYPVDGKSAEVEEIKRLIVEGGCSLLCKDEAESESAKCISRCDVLVVLVCAETSSSKSVSAAIEHASHLGKRIVGVWSASAKPSDLPEALRKLGDGTIPMVKGLLARVICGGESIWLTPQGDPQPTPPTPRHRG